MNIYKNWFKDNEAVLAKMVSLFLMSYTIQSNKEIYFFVMLKDWAITTISKTWVYEYDLLVSKEENLVHKMGYLGWALLSEESEELELEEDDDEEEEPEPELEKNQSN